MGEDVLVISLNHLTWRSCQVVHNVLGKTGFDALVAAVELGPSLLHEDDPQLVIVSVRKVRLALHARNIIINNDLLPLSIFANFDAVNAIFVLLVLKEQFRNTLRNFCQDTQTTKEVAITQTALFNVTW